MNYNELAVNNNLIFAKVNPNATIPTKDEENMGRDLYACFDEDYMFIPPHTTKLIPTGIACAMSSDYGIRIRDRGSNGSKGIHVNAGSVDSGYRGEIFVAWCNTNDKAVLLSKLSEDEIVDNYSMRDLEKGAKVTDGDSEFIYDGKGGISNVIIYPYTKAIAQAEVVVVPKMNDMVIDYEDLLKIPSKRGTGKLGSSNK